VLLATIQMCFDGFYLEHFLNSISHLVPYMSSLNFSPGFISFPVHPFLQFFFLCAPYVSPSYFFPCFLTVFLNLFPESYFLLHLQAFPFYRCFKFLLTYKCLYFLPAFLASLDAGLLAGSQYSEGPATGHLDTGFSWFSCA